MTGAAAESSSKNSAKIGIDSARHLHDDARAMNVPQNPWSKSAAWRAMRLAAVWLTAALLGTQPAVSCEKTTPEARSDIKLVIGTQIISAPYRFTKEPALLEMAKAVEELGSDTLKLSVSPKYPELYHIPKDPQIKSARDLISREPSFKAVFDKPFRHIMFWLYPFSDTLRHFRTGALSQAERDKIYQEIYDVTAYLLKTYSGSDKTFYIGNWEGDWHTLVGMDKKEDATPQALQNMREWLLLREKAISDARRDTAHSRVKVYFYVEINLVKKALKEGRPAIVNQVLPHIKTDYVSYSSYDVTNQAMKVGGEEGRRQFHEALDYIEKHLPPSDIKGKRVLIGEYGVTFESVRDAQIQAKRSAALMRWSLEWGCPFVLYWQLYCNEINEHTQKHRGYWLINEQGVKQPTWHLHQDFLRKANAWVGDFSKRHGRAPSQIEYHKAAVEWLP